MPTPSDLLRLLALPNETLSTEYKSWLPLSDNEGKAKLAKAAIAIANHGGGIIVLGMRPDKTNGVTLVSDKRPEGLRRYNQDDVNAAINRFADPAFHCELAFATHPQTGVEHAFVIVPSGLTVPVMSKRECPSAILAQRCYMRKPGPKSEEPLTNDEWRTLLDRCIKAGRENMLEAIRMIIQGHAGSIPPQAARDLLKEFSEASRGRYESFADALAPDDPAKFPYGYREATLQILGVTPAPNLTELKKRMDEAEKIKLSGWHPFPTIYREPLNPRPTDDGIEAWLGAHEQNGLSRAAHHCDYWYAKKNGDLYLIRGYDEDALPHIPPGKLIDVTIPIWRVGEMLLHAARLSKSFGEQPTIAARFKFTGLRGRRLGKLNDMGSFEGGGPCLTDTVEIAVQATASEILDNLAEVLHPVLVPLYEHFDFFELPMGLVVEELSKMQRNRF